MRGKDDSCIPLNGVLLLLYHESLHLRMKQLSCLSKQTGGGQWWSGSSSVYPYLRLTGRQRQGFSIVSEHGEVVETCRMLTKMSDVILRDHLGKPETHLWGKVNSWRFECRTRRVKQEHIVVLIILVIPLG